MADDNVVRVVLRADPGLPLEIVRQIAESLPDDMRERSAAPVDWEVDAGPGALTADEQVEAERLADVLAGQFPDGAYDIAVFVTDLPRRRGTQPIMAEVSRAEKLALLSLPALGWFHRASRARRGVVDLVTLVCDGTPPRFAQEYTVHRADPGHRSEQRFVTPGLLGRFRLLAGMIRANQPWRLFAGPRPWPRPVVRSDRGWRTSRPCAIPRMGSVNAAAWNSRGSATPHDGQVTTRRRTEHGRPRRGSALGAAASTCEALLLPTELLGPAEAEFPCSLQ